MNNSRVQPDAPRFSIGIIAWNEEDSVGAMLQSLAQQLEFALQQRPDLHCEVLCVCNGCTDNTPLIARWLLEEEFKGRFKPGTVTSLCIELNERGKINAWNQYVHLLSSARADVLFLMDADIVFNEPGTIWNMYTALVTHPGAVVAVDKPLKSLLFRAARSLPDWISLSASRLTAAGEAQLTGQLYAIRAEVARNIYLPRDLSACEDGFIKAIVCTDFLEHGVTPERILLARNASHVFAAYTSLGDLLRNQKRQMIGQTIVHILVDDHLKRLPQEQRLHLADTLRHEEEVDPSWLRRLVQEHMRKTRHFWRLIPGIVTFRFRRLAGLPWVERVLCFPAAVAGFALNMLGCWMAFHHLKQGGAGYWPDTRSPHLAGLAHPSPQPHTHR